MTVTSYGQSPLDKIKNKFDWNKTSFEIEMQPEFDISPYNSILIAEVLNSDNEIDNHANDIYDELTTSIVQMNNIELVDRKKTDLLLKEFKFQSSGLVDDKSMKQIGKFIGSGLILICRIQEDNSSESIKSVKIPLLYKTKDCATTKTREAIYDFSLNIKIIDIETTKIVYSQTIDATSKDKTTGFNCMDPAEIDSSDLYAICLDQIREKYKNLFTNHTKNVNLKFQKNQKFNDDLKQAITYFNINDFETGFKILKGIPEVQSNDKAKSAALYNLALVQFYENDDQNSLSNAKEAYILDSSNDACLTIINDLK